MEIKKSQETTNINGLNFIFKTQFFFKKKKVHSRWTNYL